MDKTIHIVDKDEASQKDVEFWKLKSSEEKLEAVQFLREQWIVQFHNQHIYDESRKGLRRVYKVVKQK